MLYSLKLGYCYGTLNILVLDFGRIVDLCFKILGKNKFVFDCQVVVLHVLFVSNRERFTSQELLAFLPS
jgi:hypothetical protein